MSPRALEILKRLIAFDTVSSEPNMALIEYVRELLASKGIESLIVKDETGKKANLFASTARVTCRACCFPGTPTWCRLPVRHGRCRRFRPPCATAVSMAVAPAT